MKSYTKIYLNHFGYSEQDYIACEVCKNKAVDIHHIYGRIGKLLTDIENLIALCRECHIKAHENKLTKKELSDIHIKKIKQ